MRAGQSGMGQRKLWVCMQRILQRSLDTGLRAK
jgi:hypothetical protein